MHAVNVIKRQSPKSAVVAHGSITTSTQLIAAVVMVTTPVDASHGNVTSTFYH